MKLTTFLAFGCGMGVFFAVAAIGRGEYASAISLGICGWFLFIAWLAATDPKETP